MKLSWWKDIWDALTGIFTDEEELPKRKKRKVSRETTPLKGTKKKVSRRKLRRWPDERARLWDQLEEELEGYVTKRDAEDFHSERDFMKEAWDLWTDPTQPNSVKGSAFEDFWSYVTKYGYRMEYFDWSDFREKYPEQRV